LYFRGRMQNAVLVERIQWNVRTLLSGIGHSFQMLGKVVNSKHHKLRKPQIFIVLVYLNKEIKVITIHYMYILK
jgi:hypothetical protein